MPSRSSAVLWLRLQPGQLRHHLHGLKTESTVALRYKSLEGAEGPEGRQGAVASVLARQLVLGDFFDATALSPSEAQGLALRILAAGVVRLEAPGPEGGAEGPARHAVLARCDRKDRPVGAFAAELIRQSLGQDAVADLGWLEDVRGPDRVVAVPKLPGEHRRHGRAGAMTGDVDDAVLGVAHQPREMKIELPLQRVIGLVVPLVHLAPLATLKVGCHPRLLVADAVRKVVDRAADRDEHAWLHSRVLAGWFDLRDEAKEGIHDIHVRRREDAHRSRHDTEAGALAGRGSPRQLQNAAGGSHGRVDPGQRPAVRELRERREGLGEGR
mmetsp:Transcript_76852/g.199739  ORF Transcript_76852/g.199739 Transcript_76852/m.199739 type:complete len:327 (-) Transcript_76852:411-1391(-)